MANSLLKLWTQTVWLYVMLLLGAGIFVSLWQNWNSWSDAQKIVAAIYILLPLHAWEEWRIPGGFGYQYNIVMGASEQPDRFPMDQLSDMITVFAAQWLGITYIWVGANNAILLSQAVFSACEVGMHTFFGIQMRRKLASRGKHTIYNPGFATAMTGFLPLMISAVITLWRAHLAFRDFIEGMLLVGLLMIITFAPEKLPRWRDPGYAFSLGYYSTFVNK